MKNLQRYLRQIGLLFLLLYPGLLVNAAAKLPSATKQAVEAVKLVNISYDKGSKLISCIKGEQVAGLKVAVKGVKTLAGHKIVFKIVSTPKKGKKAALSQEIVTTDPKGIAETTITKVPASGGYVVTAFIPKYPEAAVVSIKVEAYAGGWYIMLIVGLFGGLGMFLYGMKLAADGLQNMAGNKMKDVLSRFTKNPVMGQTVGFVATTAVQSSSATSAMCVGFVSAGLMTLVQTLAVLQGGRIGTTITAQLIAFKLSDYSLLLVLAGFVMMTASTKKKIKSIGEIMVGFGLIFFGMGVMSTAMKPLRSNPAFTTLLLSLGDMPILALLGATLFTAIIQSSGATVGLCIAFADQGLINLGGAIPMILGAMIGTCMTGLLASLSANRDGKRVAVANLLMAVILALIILPLQKYVIDVSISVTAALGSSSLTRQLANAYTLLAVFGTVVMLPFLKLIGAFVMKLMPDDPNAKLQFAPQYLQDGFENSPDIGLDLSKKEIMRMWDIVSNMIKQVPALFKEPSEEKVETMIKEDDKVDLLDDAIRPYLNTIGRAEISTKQSQEYIAQLYVNGFLEAIGDLIDKNMIHQARKLIDGEVTFSEKEQASIQDLTDKAFQLASMAKEAFEKKNYEQAEQVLLLCAKFNRLGKKTYQEHFTALRKDDAISLEESSVYLDTVDKMIALVSQINSIATTIVEEL